MTGLMVDQDHLGTAESAWTASGRIPAVAPLRIESWHRAVILAPHPDDEVLGAGGLLQVLAWRGLDLLVVAVTDGEGSHPGSRQGAQLDLPTRRAMERTLALDRLLPHPPQIARMGLPDGAVGDHVAGLRTYLAERLTPHDICIAPWWRDGHPDHDAIGSVAREAAAAAGCDLLGFLVWAWHWAAPESDDIPWDACRRLALTRRQTARKRWSTAAFRSQIRPLGDAPEDRVVLPAAVLRRSWRTSEVFVTQSGAPR